MKDLFSKQIDRDIQGVIKVGQSDAENKKQELEEYVVTKELNKHFSTFFSNYMKGVSGNTDKIGVWISGFFGSGKSHFLKILSYLLSNEKVEGKTPYSYFEEGSKISDALVLANIKRASEISSDVILFNIDAKGKKNESLAVTFLKVFNEHLGYYADNPYIAELERDMDSTGTYNSFREYFREIHGESWEAGRVRSDFIQDDLVKALNKAEVMSEDAANRWYLGVAENFDITISKFAELIKKHIKDKPDNHHVVFMVDEVGQYIGDDSNLMLNLQTITEELGNQCRGKAWVVVTSQQNIDEVVTVKGDDFSKIQGRFDTRLSLSSAHADEVIRKRLLEKKESSSEMLEGLYDKNSTTIRNLILFTESSEQKLYEDSRGFSADYPFIPYQFGLVANTLNAIRIHGASGKHLSEGERSMLSLFQESAVRLMNDHVGALVPFNIYYDPLVQFIDHSHSAVVINAVGNRNLEDSGKSTAFAVEVLKVLFLIKYVDGFKANLENVTSLMVSNIWEDRIVLQKKIEKALGQLVRESLISKNVDVYIFLTNEEQEINRAISAQHVEIDSVYLEIGRAISEEILKTNKYVYPKLNNQYIFTYEIAVDEHTATSRTNSTLALRIVTPWSEQLGDTALRQLSQTNKEVIFGLSEQMSFAEEIKNYLKIDKFLNTNGSKNTRDYAAIRGKKAEERKESKKRSVALIDESLRNATIYVNGSKRELKQTDLSAKVNESIGLLLVDIYPKLRYIDTVKGKTDIRELLMNRGKDGNPQLEGMQSDNYHGKTEVKDYLTRISTRGSVTLRQLKSDFQLPPFGFKDDDVVWLVTSLFVDGEVSYYINGELQDASSDGEQIYSAISRSTSDEKVTVAIRERASTQNKNNVNQILSKLFNQSRISDDEDTIKSEFQRLGKRLLVELNEYSGHYQNNRHYHGFPDKKVILDGISLLEKTLNLGNTFDFFTKFGDSMDDLMDFREDYEDLKEFLENEKSKKLLEDAVRYYGFFDDNRTFISDPALLAVAAEVESILDMEKPYGSIFLLNEYNEDLENRLAKQFEEASVVPLQQIKETSRRVETRIQEMDFSEKNEFLEKSKRGFQLLEEKIINSRSSAEINGVPVEAKAVQANLYAELDMIQEKIIQQAEAQQKQMMEENAETAEVEKIVIPKARKTVSIREISPTRHWEVETEADIDKHLGVLRDKLVSQLAENTIIEIEL